MRPLLYEFRWKLGVEIGILRPPSLSTCSPFHHGTNQCCSRTGKVANFTKRDNSILIYMPNCYHAGIEFNKLYMVYFFRGNIFKIYKAKTYALQ